MAYIPYSPEIGCKYWLTGPDGTVAAFNDPTDPNYVGMLTDVTGLDSASVRESGDDLVGSDGGWHGNFWYGRRPITMTGQVFGHSGATDRAARLDRLRRASNAMRSDATLTWQPNAVGSVMMRASVRRQQPLRISGAWVKDFQMLLVSAAAPLFSNTLHATAPGQNLIFDPSFESTVPSGTITNGTPSQDTAQFWDGTHSMKLVAGNLGVPMRSTGMQSVFPWDTTMAQPGQLYEASMYVRSNTTVRSWTVTISWYDSSQNLIFQSTGTSTASTNTGWTKVSATSTAPSNVYAAQVGFATTAGPASGEVHWVDAVQLIEGTGHGFDTGTNTPTFAVENQGDAAAYPLYFVSRVPNNNVDAFNIVNTTTGAALPISNVPVGGHILTGIDPTLYIDTLNHTVTYGQKYGSPTFAWGLSNVANYVNWPTAQWPYLVSGTNTLMLTGTGPTNGMRLGVQWRDAWT